MNLNYQCYSHEEQCVYVCLDNKCSQKLICESCNRSKNNKNNNNLSWNEYLKKNGKTLTHVKSVTLSINQIPIKIENFVDNLYAFCDPQYYNKERKKANELLRCIEGADRYQKLEMFKTKCSVKRQEMEDKYIKQILHQLKQFLEFINNISIQLEEKIKSLLNFSLNEFISQECLIRKQYKQQACEQILNGFLQNTQQDLNDQLNDLHSGNIELAIGVEQFANCMQIFSRGLENSISEFTRKIKMIVNDIQDNMQKIVIDQSKECFDFEKSNSQKELGLLLDEKFRKRTLNIEEIQESSSFLQLLGHLGKDNLTEEVNEDFNEKSFTEQSWLELTEKIRQLLNQSKQNKNMIKIRRATFLKQSKNSNIQTNFTSRIIKRIEEVSNLLYYPKQLPSTSKDTILEKLSTLRKQNNSQNQSPRLAYYKQNEFVDEIKSVGNSFTKDYNFSPSQNQNKSLIQQDTNSNYFVSFNSVSTTKEVIQLFQGFLMDQTKIDELIKQFFIQVSLKEKFEVQNLQNLQVLNKKQLILAYKNGTLEMWEMKQQISEKRLSKSYSITNEHNSIKILIQLTCPGLIMTCGNTHDDYNTVIKIWSVQYQSKLDVVYEIRDLHKGSIGILISLEQKISGLFPNNIYNKEAGSCGMLYFCSYCQLDGIKIWKISYYGGRISESKITNISLIPMKGVIHLEHRNQCLYVLKFSEFFDKIVKQNQRNLVDEVQFKFGKDYIIFGSRSGEITILDYQLELISKINFLKVILKEYLDAQQSMINKFTRGVFESKQNRLIMKKNEANNLKLFKIFQPNELNKDEFYIGVQYKVDGFGENVSLKEIFVCDLKNGNINIKGQLKGIDHAFNCNLSKIIKIEKKLIVLDGNKETISIWNV